MMIYVIYFFAGVFIVLAASMLFVFYRTTHFGSFLMGAIYGASGVVAIWLAAWWPLVFGFVLVWMLKLMGLEPAAQATAEGASQEEEGAEGNAEGEGRKGQG
jgi:hypothetical protein